VFLRLLLVLPFLVQPFLINRADIVGRYNVSNQWLNLGSISTAGKGIRITFTNCSQAVNMLFFTFKDFGQKQQYIAVTGEETFNPIDLNTFYDLDVSVYSQTAAACDISITLVTMPTQVHGQVFYEHFSNNYPGEDMNPYFTVGKWYLITAYFVPGNNCNGNVLEFESGYGNENYEYVISDPDIDEQYNRFTVTFWYYYNTPSFYMLYGFYGGTCANWTGDVLMYEYDNPVTSTPTSTATSAATSTATPEPTSAATSTATPEPTSTATPTGITSIDFSALTNRGFPEQYNSILLSLFVALLFMSMPRGSKHRFQCLAWVLLFGNLATAYFLVWFASLLILIGSFYVNSLSEVSNG